MSNKNNNNLAQNTNFICGSSALELTQIYCTSLALPGISLNHPFITSGNGSPLNLTGDNVMFNSLQLSLLVDEDYDVYFEFITKLQENISFVNGSYSEQCFDFFIDITNSKGNHVFKINMVNCRIQSIGDLELNTGSEDTEMLLPIELIFDHIEYVRGSQILKISN